MLQVLEILLIQLGIWFYSLPSVVGLATFGILASVFIISQFSNKESYVPGAIGVIFTMLTLFHLFWSDFVIERLSTLIVLLETPRTVKPIPLLEPLFGFFVAPTESRYFHQELIFVVVATYLGFVVYEGVRQYRKTGSLIGALSPLAIGKNRGKRPERSKFNELGSADLASPDQINRWTRERTDFTHVPPYTRLNVFDLKGAGGAIALKSGNLMIPQGERNRHMLMIAKTGGGKTSKFILPILYDDCLCPTRSTIVLDSKPEMWSKLANLTRKYNPKKQILLFNPLDTVRSLSWNILSKIETDTDAKLIANTIVMATDNPSAKSDSPFFRNNALAILNAIMVGLLSDPSETLSMPRIHQLIQSGMKDLASWLESHPDAIRTTKTFVELVRSGSQNAETIMSELSMRLAAWDLKAIRSTTWKNELDPSSIVEKPTLFIVELRESELEMLRPMANVIVVELLRFLTKYAEGCPGHKLPRPVGFVIDEFASALGQLPDIHVKLNTLRSRNVSIVAAIQSIAQVKANYGDNADSVLAGFSTKIFLPPLDLQDGEWASKETGQMTVRFKTKSTGSNKKKIEIFASQNDGTQEQVQQRAVLTPDEVMRPADNCSTFFMPETAPFQGQMEFYFNIPELKSRIEESENAPQLKLRSEKIEIEETAPTPVTPANTNGSAGAPAAAASNGTSSSAPSTSTATAANGGTPAGISDTRGWSDQQVADKLDETKRKLEWDSTTGSARKWWEAFEAENKHRTALVLRLAEELSNRNATITEFFLAYVYSNTDNIQANLHYLDYSRLKKEDEKRKREAQQKSSSTASSSASASSVA